MSLHYTRIPETYAEWQTRVFGADAGNPAISGETADPDRDGRSNLMEYATGTDALTPQSGEVLAMQSGSGSPANLVFSFTKNLKAAPEVEMIVEESDALTGWVPVQAAEQTEVLTAEHLSRVSLTVARNQARRFYRLRVAAL